MINWAFVWGFYMGGMALTLAFVLYGGRTDRRIAGATWGNKLLLLLLWPTLFILMCRAIMVRIERVIRAKSGWGDQSSKD